MNIPVNKVVKVTISTTPAFPQRKGFGELLIIGASTVLPVAERMREFSDIVDVGAAFGTSSQEYKAAAAWFSQRPAPTTLRIGRRFMVDVAGENLGSLNHTKDTALWQAVTAGALDVNIDGTVYNVTGLDFSTDLSLAAVAARITAALVTAGATGAAVDYTGSRFVIRSGSTGVSSAVGYTTAPATGTYIGVMLGTDATLLPTLSKGALAESAATCLSKMQDFNDAWYGFHWTKEAATVQDWKDSGEWAEALVKIFGYTTSDQNVKDPLVTGDIASYFHEKGYRRTFGMFDSDDDYATVSAIARAFVVNFNEQNSTLTLKFKVLPGQTPEPITTADKLALDAKKINYYTRFGESAMLAESTMADGTFFDEVHGLDWFQNAIETNVFGFLYTRKTKVPQTDKGMQLIVQQVENACKDAVNNGLLAPGQWNGGEFGQLETGTYLKTGYYIFAHPMASQNIGDRHARKAPPIQVAAKGAGAIHFVDIGVEFDR